MASRCSMSATFWPGSLRSRYPRYISWSAATSARPVRKAALNWQWAGSCIRPSSTRAWQHRGCTPTLSSTAGANGWNGSRRMWRTSCKVSCRRSRLRIGDPVRQMDAVVNGISLTGKQVTVTGIVIHRLANGKFVEDREELDALGLLQQPRRNPQRRPRAGIVFTRQIYGSTSPSESRCDWRLWRPDGSPAAFQTGYNSFDQKAQLIRKRSCRG